MPRHQTIMAPTILRRRRFRSLPRAYPPLALLLLLAAPRAAGGDNVARTLRLGGRIPYTALDFFAVPFFVPPGTAELQANHSCTDGANTSNILDFGLADCGGSVIGWGGGNAEPAVVGARATSRSYMLPAGGALQTGCNYSALFGKARVAVPPAHFALDVTLRDAPTLAPQPQRAPYARAAPLAVPAAPLTWFSGDFHVHSRESGDAFANATLDEIAAFARSVGLDFVHVSDHNAVSASTFMVDAQSRHPDLLLLPGVEFTTYSGHGGALFTTSFVDHRIGNPGATIQGAADAIHAQGGLLSINHLANYEPDANGDLRNTCVGCAWSYGGTLSAQSLDAVEVAVQTWTRQGQIQSPRALEYWDRLHFLGHTHVAPIGGSDDHHGGASPGSEGSVIGSPTTMVLAANLSHAAIREGVALGRVALKFNNASDPLVDLVGTSSGGASVRVGGTLAGLPLGATVTLQATVTASAVGGAGRPSMNLQLVRNNEQTVTVALPQALPFSYSVDVPLPDGGQDRWRAELHDAADDQIVCMTNHVFLNAAAQAGR